MCDVINYYCAHYCILDEQGTFDISYLDVVT
jgi:hypothetical protein